MDSVVAKRAVTIGHVFAAQRAKGPDPPLEKRPALLGGQDPPQPARTIRRFVSR
ncbi:hypothetical protein [Actinomadura sp. NPDC048394]|uniref:hypothetical protein n=1 Tax=Actinomadura sp. NPDC048394 TaxID=3158223 RepID=UPI0033C7EE4E